MQLKYEHILKRYFQVLPHLTDLRVFDKYRYTTALFTELRRVLKSGGVLAINTCTHAQLGAVWLATKSSSLSVTDNCCLYYYY